MPHAIVNATSNNQGYISWSMLYPMANATPNHQCYIPWSIPCSMAIG
jgi:hypothetical protein